MVSAPMLNPGTPMPTTATGVLSGVTNSSSSSSSELHQSPMHSSIVPGSITIRVVRSSASNPLRPRLDRSELTPLSCRPLWSVASAPSVDEVGPSRRPSRSSTPSIGSRPSGTYTTTPSRDSFVAR